MASDIKNATMNEMQDIAAKVETIQDLLSEKFGMRKRALPKMLRRVGRRVPRRVRKQAQVLAQAEGLAAHPKLVRRVDRAAVSQAFDEVRTHLRGIDVADRRKGIWLSLAGSVAFNLLAVGVGVIVVLLWRGII